MNKVKIFNINFDFKVKILIVIAVIIAVTIISYSFYNICFKSVTTQNNILDIQEFVNMSGYEVNYDVTVNSNKNSNTYSINENADLLNKKYTYLLDNKIKIDISESQIKITKEDIDYEYIDIMNYASNNFISFSTIIDIINKIDKGEASGNITRVEVDDNIIFKIHLDEEYIKKIKDIDIKLSKSDAKIVEVKMYNFDNIEQYYIKFNSFVVKK